MHVVMSVVFGLIHVALFTAFDLETSLAAWGILFGFVHWLISGMGLGMIPATYPLILRGKMDAPGVLALKYSPMTAMGFSCSTHYMGFSSARSTRPSPEEQVPQVETD